LSEFNLDIQHISGVDNEIADYLSRVKLRKIDSAQANVAKQEEEEPQWVLNLEKFSRNITGDKMKEIREQQAVLSQNKPQHAEWDKQLEAWVVKQKDGRPVLWVPDESILDTLIITDHNWSHFSWKQTYQRIKRLIYWPKLRKKVKAMLDNCSICQRVKAFRRLRLSPAKFEALNAPFEVIHVDHLYMGETKLLPHITECITMIDRFTGLLMAVPLPQANTQQSLLVFFNHIISKFGVPRILVSDN